MTKTDTRIFTESVEIMPVIPKTARDRLREVLEDRRQFRKGSAEWKYLTRAAVTYLRLVRGIPTTEWN